MRKLFLVIWGINTVALAWLLASILLLGTTPDRKHFAGELTEIWVGLAAVYGWALFASKRRAKQEEKERRLMRAAVNERTRH
jgi:hypothetical protein